MSRTSSVKRHSSGGAGTLTVDFDLGLKKVVITEINAGFGVTEWGQISAYLNPREETDPHPPYFFSGLATPSPPSPHASIAVWHGRKFMDGHEYQLRVRGRANEAASTLYVEVVFETVE